MVMKYLIPAALLSLAMTGTAQASLVYDYELNGDLTNSSGGANIVTEGGTLGATGYTFAANQGLAIANAAITGVYTIDLRFSFTQQSGYQKIVDFQNLTTDSGLYTLGTALNFFPVNSSTGLFSPNVSTDVRFTRNASGLAEAFVNGASVFTFNDTTNLAVFNPGVMRFFHDDNATGQREASAGFVDYIRVYDTANATPGGVPEPATWAMMIVGFGVAGSAMRRRKSAQTAIA